MSSGLPFGFGAPDPDRPGSTGGPGSPFDMSSLGAMLQQLGQALQQSGSDTSGAAVNWQLVADAARQALTAAPGDASIDQQASDHQEGDQQALEWLLQSSRIADLWLDEATTFPASGTSPAAWSRQDWVDRTLPSWRRYVEPLAERLINVVGSTTVPDLGQLSADDLQAALPEQFRQLLPEGVTPQMMSMLQPMLGMMRQLSVAAFSMQLGQGLGALAREVVSAGDIGIPLQEAAQVAVLPANVAVFGEGLGIPEAEVRLYVTLRESAHQRLFAHVPWLRGRLAAAIEEVASGVHVDPERLQQAVAEVDMSDPAALQQLVSSGLLQPEQTPQQRAALERLQTLLALVEGWVEDVTGIAMAGRMSSGAALREMMARRRATGGPAERAFANLVGLELRPKAVREAANLFAAVRELRSPQVRDGLWAHPDLLPDTADLADPLDFVERLADG
ncbi:MAG: zinc-dependent metalloprotease [Actinomycetales bacterium]